MAGSEDVGARRSTGPPPPLPGILASLTRLGIFRQAAMQRKPLAGEGGILIVEHMRGAGVAEVEGSFVVGV